MFDFNGSLSLGYLKVKIDGLPIPKGSLVKGPIKTINQYCMYGRLAIYFSMAVFFSLTRVIQKNRSLVGVWSYPFVFQAFALILCAQATCLDSRFFFALFTCEKAEDFETTFFEISWLFGKKTWQVANFCKHLGETIIGGKLKF